MPLILHIASYEDWEAQKKGFYQPAAFAGFIHCSTPEQIIPIANYLFFGKTGLILLLIDQEKIFAQVRYENLEGGEKLFPHIYGLLNLDAVIKVFAFNPDKTGKFALSRRF